MDDEQIETYVEIGRRNKEIIRLATLWCRHIRRDSSLLGVGMLEVMTDLPISGGTFTCDHRRGASQAGMELERIALDFYKRNCVGCQHRQPTGIVENLGTWADKLIEEEDARARANTARLAVEDEERESRKRSRRLTFGSSNAALQAALDLVERLDSREPDPTAAVELDALARLHADVFDSVFVGHLLELASKIRSPGLATTLATLCTRVHTGARDLIG